MLTGVSVLHAVTDERVLELGTHESISVARPVQNQEVNLEHGHVERQRHDDQTKRPRQEVLGPHRRCHAQVTEQQPELSDCAESKRRDSEESDPLTAERSRKRQTGKDEVLPPFPCERLPFRIEVGKSHPEVDGERGEEDKIRIEQDQPGLRDQGVVEHDEKRAEDGGRERHAKRDKGKESQRDKGETKGGGEESHDDIWYVVCEVVPTVSSLRLDGDCSSLSDFLELEVAVEAPNPS